MILGEEVVKNKIILKKLYTQHSLEWSLKVGNHLGTLTRYQAMRLVNVKPVTFHRWLSGKLAAPENKLEKIKSCAFADFRRRPRKIAHLSRVAEADVEVIKAKFLWKNMLFDQLHMTAKRRYCAGLTRLHR